MKTEVTYLLYTQGRMWVNMKGSNEQFSTANGYKENPSYVSVW